MKRVLENLVVSFLSIVYGSGSLLSCAMIVLKSCGLLTTMSWTQVSIPLAVLWGFPFMVLTVYGLITGITWLIAWIVIIIQRIRDK